MPAGSGPQVAQGAANQSLSTTAETVVATVPLSNWNSVLGNLLSAFVIATSTAALTLTLRIRQGSGTGGTIVGSAAIYTFAGAATTVPVGVEVADTSAFGLSQQQGQYTLTAQASVASDVTLVTSLLELETIAPVQ